MMPEGRPPAPPTRDMPRMIDCSEAERRLQRFIDRELTPEEEAEVRMHLDQCVNCRSRFRFEAGVKRLVRTGVEAEETPPSLRERVLRLLAQMRHQPKE